MESCMIIAGFDLETSGLELGSARILEIGCALFSTEINSIFYRFSSWVWDVSYPEPEPEALKVNGLTVDGLKLFGVAPSTIFPIVKRLFEQSDCIMAHNGASFDLPILKFEFSQFNIEIPNKLLIDTRTDLPFPNNTTSRRLSHLAVDHDVVYGVKHRALSDIEAMFSIASQYNLQEVLERCKSPLIRIEAHDIAYKNKHLVKNRRYNWDAEKKIWWKMVREVDYEKEVDESNFIVFKCPNTNETKSRAKISKQDPPAT